MKKSYIVIIVILITTLAAAYGYRKYMQRDPVFTRGMVNKPAPDFSLPSLSGGKISLQDYRGKLVLLNFWASWCPPCRAEIPGFIKIQKAYQDKPFVIIGAALEDKRDAETFAKDIGINYPIAFGVEPVHDAASAYGDPDGALPYSVLISPDQKILAVYAGFLSEEKLTSLIKKHLPD